MNQPAHGNSAKLPLVTAGFWAIKILATTLGETGGDALSMTMNLGYALSSLIFIAIFAAVLWTQILAKSFHPFLYWAVIVATTTAGTTMADFVDRSLHIGYTGGTAILIVLLLLSLAIWHKSTGSISVQNIVSRRDEMHYWVTILFSQTLGTALGDWAADTNGLGYKGGVMVFAAALAAIAGAYYFTHLSRTVLFWSAFILTRPLGATVGDFLDKPIQQGGLAFSRFTASAILAAVIVACILWLPQNPGKHAPAPNKDRHI